MPTELELFPFQQEMVKKFLDPKYPHVLCGDDMGLGKTIEAMTLDIKKRQLLGSYGQTLIVAPLTVVSDAWEQSYAKFFPDLRVAVLNPKGRSAFLRTVEQGKHDIHIMHWDALRLMPELSQRVWFHVIADEAHRMKNRKAQVTRALKRIKAHNKLGLTGTPADNKPHDLWSILNWLYPATYSSYWRFYNAYVEYKKHPVHGYHMVSGVRNEKHLQRTIAPFYIRRQKEEVLEDLPEKYYTTFWVDLTPKQRKAYEQMRKKQLAWVGENLEKPLSAPMVATQLMRLQQFACANVDIELVMKRIKNKLFNPDLPEVPESEVVTIIDIARLNWKWRHIQVPNYLLVEPSSKLDAVMQIQDDTNLPLVVWTQFKKMAYLLGNRLKEADISYGLCTGDQSKSQRDDLVRDFQAGKRKVFIGTIACAREGITLTRSSTEVFIDRAWSAAWNRQSEDRCHRIGQVNAVQIFDILARDTIDYGRKQQIELKWSWVQKLLGDNVLHYQQEMAA
jgi:SNF2 family DNA or RNA helicase